MTPADTRRSLLVWAILGGSFGFLYTWLDPQATALRIGASAALGVIIIPPIMWAVTWFTERVGDRFKRWLG